MPFHTDFRFKPYRDEKGNLKPHPPAERIYGPVSSIGPLTVCAYLVETSAGLAAVDAGYDSDGDLLVNNIRALGLEPQDLKLILLTHWHQDHASGAARLAKATGAKVVIHEKDAEIVATGACRGESIMPPVKIDKRLKDGEVVELGGVAFKTVHCPGQSAGEVVFLATVNGPDGPCRTIFAGDATGFKDDVKTLDRLGYPGVCADFRRTVGILRALEFDLYLGGHPHQVFDEARADGHPFISRDEWLKLVNGRSEQMETFVKQHPRYLDW
ncbi:MAG: MBL fold metallo-hydrolase [Acidobacteria bacterium]|nr:MBL fold metallo-hydrolase [Acidobacteriota bacterium]MBI3830992.1 MBL fold metallo-hydrolase [Planctomycetota bacterium]